MARTTKPRLVQREALYVTQVAASVEECVYALVTDRPLAYGHRKSRIAYIGKTGTGAWRLTSTVGERCEQLFANDGVDCFRLLVVTCPRVPRVDIFHKLERAMLLAFREKFDCLPRCNAPRSVVHEHDEFELLDKGRVLSILKSLERAAA